MTRRSLTPKPSVPALVRMAAIGALAWSPFACGDDGANDSNTSDQFPTDVCSHDPQAPGCGTTGDVTATEADDVAPTIPCAHDPNACESTGPDLTTGSSAATETEGDTDPGTDTDTGGSSGSGSGTSTTGGA